MGLKPKHIALAVTFVGGWLLYHGVAAIYRPAAWILAGLILMACGLLGVDVGPRK